MIRRRECGIEFPVVVDLPIGSHNDVTIFAAKRLGSTLRINDREALVSNAVVAVDDVAAPVRTSVSEEPRRLDKLSSKLDFTEGRAEDSEDAAHMWMWSGLKPQLEKR